MFDFWKEVIINDAKRVKALSAVGGAIEKKGLRVFHCADYESKYVVGGTVYKTLPTKGTPAVINLSALAAVAEGATSVDRRVRIELGLTEGHADSEFARPWSKFALPVVVEFAGADAKKALGALQKALRAALDSHIAVIPAEGEENAGNLVLVDPKVCVKKLEIADRDAAAEDGWAETDDVLADALITPNQVPVGTGEWILKNLRFPTHVNTYVGAPNADDVPEDGAEYVQYAFEYCVPKRGFHGQGAVGQAVASVTHHVFYVKSDLVDAVEAAFKELTTVVDGGKLVLINEADAEGKVADEANQQYYSNALDMDITVAVDEETLKSSQAAAEVVG